MRRSKKYLLPSLLVIFLTGWSYAEESRPNVILIMADDMGYSDIGCYGGEIQTPNLDQLAANGLRFTQFYNTARCCPTRASLLTGLYPHQAGVGHMMSDRGYDGYRGDLNRKSATIAEVLGASGYRTYMAGKWHVTKHTRPVGPKDNWPVQRGFHRFYGTIHGAGSFFDPNTLTRDNTYISPYSDPEYKPETYYYTDAISDQTVRYISEHQKQNKSKPFFIYVSYTAAHWPMHALPEDIAKYDGKYDAGYGPIRKARIERMKEFGIIDKNSKLSPQAGDWDKVQNKEWEAAGMEVYAAMVDRMDQGIGKIVNELKRQGQLDNTVLMYFQDNGGCAEGYGRRGNRTRADKPTLKPMELSALQPSMIPRQTRDGYPVLQGTGVLPGPADTFISYGRGWANVSDTPFREYKHWVHEGGIATPLVIHWPKGIQAKGELRQQPSHLIDIMTTCVEISGAEYPTKFKGNDIQQMEGRSLVTAFENKPLEREAIYWEHEGNRAVRAGKWKLVAKGSRGQWELYDMENDRTELNNLASAEPARAKSLADMWQKWAERANVLPINPRGKRSLKKAAQVSKNMAFTFKQGVQLPRDGKLPNVAGKAILIKATITAEKPDGIILAHGGSSHGYAIYLKGGKLAMSTRVNGRHAMILSPDKLPAGQVEVEGILAKDGKLSLKIAGQEVAAGKSKLLTQLPLDGLDIGQDLAGAIGDYKIPNSFTGKIETVELKLE